jgi:acyl-CoA synthetase (NDP forming)
LKIGTSQVSAAIAMAHTGSLVGDDLAFDAACIQHGLIRVRTIEDLITTAGLLAHTGVLEKQGVGVVSISGGGCGLFGDASEQFGVSLPAFAPETTAALREVQSSYGTILNPFDITGAAVGDPSMFEKCLDIIGRDPAIGLTVCALSLATTPERAAAAKRMYGPIGAALGRLGSRGLMMNAAVRPLNAAGLELMRETGIVAAFGGIEHVVRAIGKAQKWSQRVNTRRPSTIRATPDQPEVTGRLESERDVLGYLSNRGVPVVPGTMVSTAEQAVEAARALGGRVALKVASPDVQHKTEVGGVRLGVEGAVAIAHAFDTILA